MKKLIPILIIAIVIMSAGAVVIYKKQFDVKHGTTIDYTMKEFAYAPVSVKNKQTRAEPVQYGFSIPLQSVLSNVYYTVNFPNTIDKDDIITDYVSYIATRDMTVYVQKITNINPDDFSTLVGIDNPESLSPNCIEEQFSGKKEEQRAAILFGNTAYVLRCSDNPVAYSTIVKSFLETEETSYSSYGMPEFNNLEYIPQYSLEDEYVCDLSHDFSNITTRTFYFKENGYLSMYRELSSFEEVINHSIDKLSIISGSDLKGINKYINDNICYFEYGQYTCAVISVNYNTSIVLFGIDDLARANITLYCNSL